MKKLEKAKKLMEEGWKAREDHQFETAFTKLTEAKKIFEEENDWFNVTEALNHLAYTEKLLAAEHSQQGLDRAKESLTIATKYDTKKGSALRALISLQSSMGLYEEAIINTNKNISLIDKLAPKADLLAHLSLFQLRTGKIDEAEKTITEAEKLLEEGFEEEREPHRSIWKCKILMTKGLISYDKGNLEEAKALFEQAREIAKAYDLKTRLQEAQNLLNLIS